MGPAKRTRVPGDKDHCPLSELTEARGRKIREFLVSSPSYIKVLWHPWLGPTKVSK